MFLGSGLGVAVASDAAVSKGTPNSPKFEPHPHEALDLKAPFLVPGRARREPTECCASSGAVSG